MKKRKKQRTHARTFSRISYKERVKIEQRYCTDRWRITAIAAELERPTSAVSREIGGKPRIGRGRYNADRAQERADVASARQGRTAKMEHALLNEYVVSKLKTGWSPEQIAIRLPIDYPKEVLMRISYESIYAYVYDQVHRGGNGKVKKGCEDLRPHLPRRHTRRQKKGFRQTRKEDRPVLPSIEDRPKSVEKRKEIGHWEDDTMVSRKSTVRLKTINERVSGIIFIGKMKDGSIAESNRVVIERLSRLPRTVRKTLTRDRGTENFGHREIEKELNMTCWFAHAYCSQERGSNENGNGLIRRPYPKKTDFEGVSDADIRALEYRLNSRPRKRHGGLTPYEVFFKLTGVALDS
jgi:IS30 family transposase